MAQQSFNNGDALSAVRTLLNSNATDAESRIAALEAGGLDTALQPGDIDTLAELNAVITDATLIDTTDARLSDSRTPTAHDHAASEITSGVIDTARLGSGTADGTTFLAGDQTYKAIAAGGFPAFASSMRTASFTADSALAEIIDIQDATDIIGTLPASPSDGDERIFYVRGEATDPLGRFQIGLNGNTIQAGTNPTVTKTTSWESGLAAGYTELGITSVTSGSVSDIGLARTGTKGLQFSNNNAFLQFTVPNIVGTGVFSFYKQSGGGELQVNGVTQVTLIGGAGWVLFSTNVVTGDVVRIQISQGSGDDSWLDDFQITNAEGSGHADWTNVSPWEVSPGGLLRIRWSTLLNTWVVIDYRA